MATLATYGCFLAKSGIGAVAACLQHNLRQCQILNPVSKARDRTHILMDIMSGHYVLTLLSHNGNSKTDKI